MTPDRAPDPTQPTVLVVGAASRDIATEDPRGWRLGGAVSYGSLTLARFGLHVRAFIGVDAEAARAQELDVLRDAGVDVELARLARGPVFENIEAPEGRRQRCLSVADPILVSALPDAWRRSDAVFLGPVAGELGDGWASITAPHVVLGWQGLLRRVRAGVDVARLPPAANSLLAAASLVGASREDFAAGTTPESLRRLVAPSATLVLTDGAAGGLVLDRGSEDRDDPPGQPYPAIPSDGVIDATGAGDVFLAAMLAARLQPALVPSTGASNSDDLGGAVRLAAAASSLAVEAPGVFGVPTLAAALRRATRAPRRASRRPSATSSRGSGRPSQA
ncbi:MAG: hypothetical protein E6I65_07715 [Chloroflexi bacterium]|nr:MAG: hypothetical protein E6I65_07715 [Chloroflexota bacterium]